MKVEDNQSSKEQSNGREVNISIFAGNSRVSLDETNRILVEPQLMAFDAALKRASDLRMQVNSLPYISIAFDHKGIFRKQFLKSGLTNSQKRHPKLSQLTHEIVTLFEPYALKYAIALSDITVIHEDSARMHASYIIETGNHPQELLHWMQASVESLDEDDKVDVEDSTTHNTNRVTCALVTSEYFASSVKNSTRSLEVFFENDPWSRVSVYVRGVKLMEGLGRDIKVKLLLVSKQGRVFGR
ncbi:hypothetical protein [Rufibacter quisquiliarum]|uniref:Uncharacterized protein n=1 Tax=Rufibacter quisquiliarum TaxID=1549639 RepID=A0A839GNR0_9BACT|nr:hypothetical protein [Rufibacter quisquiliarum]MBA9076556.1 hypothetical protein [Rufibacter quisquiliarum]